jgi:hypothetical protein
MVIVTISAQGSILLTFGTKEFPVARVRSETVRNNTVLFLGPVVCIDAN